jgi:hypothetical protein
VSAKPPTTGLLEACDDPKLFGLDLWPKQREQLAEVERHRLTVMKNGRRSGKSTHEIAPTGLWSCLLRPELRGYLRPRERGYAVVVATNLRQARLVVSAARSIVETSPLLKGMLESAGDDELLFRNGMAFAAFPCTSRGGRGWPIFCLALDEAAHMLDTEGNSAAERVWEALMPSTAQFGADARVIVSSTPYGEEGLFAALYRQAESGELADAVALSATSAEANPMLTPEFLAAEEARDPESFRGEYLAEFVGSGGAFFDARLVEACVSERGELTPEQGTDWVAGLDPAFSSDPFGLALVGRAKDDPGRLVLGAVRSWAPAKRKLLSFGDQRDRQDEVITAVAAVCREFGARVVTDQYAARAVTDALAREGLRVSTRPLTAASKTQVFTETRARLYAGALELYGQPDLLAELRRIRTRYASGSSSVVTPRVGGTHCDLAVALAMAVFEHRGGGSAFPALSTVHVIHGFSVPEHWKRVEALAGGALTAWLRCAVDEAGNLIGSGLPSELGRRVRARGGGAACHAPRELLGGRAPGVRRQFGDPAEIADDYADVGVSLVHGDDDRAAGFVRVGELLRVMQQAPLPEWHPHAGAKGAPRLFVFDTCTRLLDQLRSAPLEADDEPLPGVAVSRKWELVNGPAVMALRLAVMSRPAPANEPPQREDSPVDPDEQRRDWLAQRYRERDERRRDRSTYA